jgi:hypothetical protein
VDQSLQPLVRLRVTAAARAEVETFDLGFTSASTIALEQRPKAEQWEHQEPLPFPTAAALSNFSILIT